MARTVEAILEARVAGYNSAMAGAAKSTEKVAAAVEGVGKEVDQTTKESEKAAQSLAQLAQDNEKAWSGVQNSLALVGAAAGGVAALAVREFSTFDQAMSGVASTGEDAKNNIDDLRQAAMDMGADTAFSAVEAANGVEELTRAGVEATEILGGGLAGALDLAAAGEIGVAEAAGIASTAMTQFKLSGEEIPHLADLLAAGAGKAMGGVDDLGMALKQSGLVASQFGLSIEETVGGLSAFAAAGLLGSDAGTSLKSMLLALANPAGATAKKMAELGINAYDASGQFIGLEGLAGNLRVALADLTDAQRQQALAQIFGTDAIRAASILYEEGAEGIAQWTEAVDDAGYAAETAAELQNNLIGDLEKLGGSWSTLAIQMGEVADGPLRQVVQGLTSLLDVAGESPAAASAIMIAVSSIAALGLGTAALMKGISIVADLKTNLMTLGASEASVNRVTGAIGKMSKVAGVAAAAFLGFQIIGRIADDLDSTAVSVDEVSAALERFNKTANVTEFDRLFRDAEDPARGLSASVDDLSSALERAKEYGADWNIEAEIESVAGALLGMDFASQKLDQVFKDLDQSMSQLPAEEAAAAFEAFAAKATELGYTNEELVALVPKSAQAIRDQINAINASGDGFQSYVNDAAMVADILAGRLPEGLVMTEEGLKTTAQAARDAEPPFDAYAAAQERAAASAEGHQEALDQVAEVLAEATAQAQGYGNALLALSGSQIGVEAAIDAATAALEKNGKTLDLDTEKGRANQQALNGLAGAGQELIQTMFEQGAATEDIVAATEKSKKAFIDTATAMGMPAEEAARLAEAYFAIPSEVDTWLRSQGLDAALADKQRWQDALDGLSEEEVTEFLADLDGASAEEVRGRLDALARDRTVNVNVRQIGGEIIITPTVRGGGRGISIPGVEGKATGGPIRGPGTTTSDSILIAASDREYMLRAWAADKIGQANLDYMNRTGRIPGFATGGRISADAVPASATAGGFSRAALHAGNVTNITNVDVSSREGLNYLTSLIRDADVIHYTTEGVH